MGTPPSLLNLGETSLRKKINQYRKVAREIQGHLTNHPHEWGKFQSDFNIELNGIFRDIMNFEKQSLAGRDEESVYKLKRLFINHLRKEFVRGEYIVWSLNKPYGYPGDFKIIDDIYRNAPTTTGFDRLYDNYFQMSAISIAVRNRKEDFKKIITSYLQSRTGKTARVMVLAAGPCRELHELMSTNLLRGLNVTFDCYDHDERAFQYGKLLLQDYNSQFNFIKDNVVRLALKKEITTTIETRYELIYTTGLFDYLDRRISSRLVQNLRKILKKDGMLAVSDVRDKYQNPSVHFMEWVGDWNLIYRSDEEFKQIFLDGNFKPDELRFASEQQGIMQYITGLKTE